MDEPKLILVDENTGDELRFRTIQSDWSGQFWEGVRDESGTMAGIFYRFLWDGILQKHVLEKSRESPLVIIVFVHHVLIGRRF